MGCYVWKNILVKVTSFKAFDTRTQTDPKRSDDSRVHRLTARDGAPALSEDQRVGLSLNFGPFGGRGKARHRFRLRSALVAGDAQRLRACPRDLRAPPFVSLLSCPPVPSLVLAARASSLPLPPRGAPVTAPGLQIRLRHVPRSLPLPPARRGSWSVVLTHFLSFVHRKLLLSLFLFLLSTVFLLISVTFTHPTCSF